MFLNLDSGLMLYVDDVTRPAHHSFYVITFTGTPAGSSPNEPKGCATCNGYHRRRLEPRTHCIGLSRDSSAPPTANRFTRDNILQSVCIEGGCSSLDPLDRDNGKIFQLGKTNAPLSSSNQKYLLGRNFVSYLSSPGNAIQISILYHYYLCVTAIPYCSVKFELPHYISSDFQWRIVIKSLLGSNRDRLY